MVGREQMSVDEVRRSVLAAQGFGARRSGRPVGVRRLQSAIERIGLLQVDSVNVLARAHYLPLFSRLGPYNSALLDQLGSVAPRRLFEYWGHEASLIPVGSHPLLRWRMADGHAWSGPRRVAREHPGLVDEVRAAVADLGPVTASELEAAIGGEHGRSQDYHWGWNWSDAKRALEYLFGCGEISTAERDRSFARRYDLTERVIPADVLGQPTPARADAVRGLVSIGARALGVATEAELRDYWRLRPEPARAAIAELVDDGELVPIEVPGWPAALRHRDAVVPRRATGDALLAPFDPLVWHRSRTERLFGMRYRIEIYVPAERREFGYYVLPYLHHGSLVARLDLKADRAAGRLLVRGGWSQRLLAGPGHRPPEEFAEDLARQLRALAGWLSLDDVDLGDRGDLSQALRPFLGRR